MNLFSHVGEALAAIGKEKKKNIYIWLTVSATSITPEARSYII